MSTVRPATDSASTDPTTDALDRVGFTAAVEGLRRGRGPGSVQILAVDVVGLDEINRAHGWSAGDAVLRAIASHLGELAPGGVVGRIAADELAVAFIGDDDVARFLAQEVERPVTVRHGDRDIVVSVTTGVAADDPQTAPLEGIDRADLRRSAIHHRAPN